MSTSVIWSGDVSFDDNPRNANRVRVVRTDTEEEGTAVCFIDVEIHSYDLLGGDSWTDLDDIYETDRAPAIQVLRAALESLTAPRVQ